MTSSPLPIVLDRLILLLMLLALAGTLTAAMVLQVAFGEIPCPLCLLQRVAMFGCCFGLIQQLHAGESAHGLEWGLERGSERGSGLALVFALLLLVISGRQTLLDIVPRPGHAYVGSAVLGLHMPVWSVVIALALLLGFAVRFALFGAPRTAGGAGGAVLHRWVRGLEFYVVLLCALNFVAVILQCGLDQCHTSGYRLL
ncbi:Disulfide bond formation protein DsbB [Enhydrobacter aerosaccus]|uniref:Disulfide bond formation protein DsbB n=1 Tax=Enhydrobacter aerosaccus TaxID=225324 RepID=A0A1T4K059_9HYPH|nr:disulfide bond formation protein B [Enhydrobacter aerosaccus]SJZ35764.1 Disulfide bond formation protein DsbB [Enhydrobacter aerosaccus]